MKAETIQVKVSFRGQNAIEIFPISAAADDVRKWAIAHFGGQIDDATSMYTLFQIDSETNSSERIEGNFVDLKDLIREGDNVLEFRLDHEQDSAGCQR